MLYIYVIDNEVKNVQYELGDFFELSFFNHYAT